MYLLLTKDSQYIREPFRAIPSATAKLKRNQIQSIKDEYALKTQQYNHHQTELQNLIAENTLDPVKREHNMKRIEELKHEKAPELDIIRIRELEFEAATAENQDALQTEIRRLEHEKQQDDKQSKSVKTMLSGAIKWVVVGE